MIRRLLVAALAALPLLAFPAMAEDEDIQLLDGHFTFNGPFGTIDKAAAQRGWQVYREVCSNCHGLYEQSYRDLDGLGYSEAEVKAFAAEAEVTDISDDTGKPIKRTHTHPCYTRGVLAPTRTPAIIP